MPRNLPNWIEAYMAYSNESESPDAYHWWVAASAIAGALERQVYFDMGYFTVYPNNYVVLVSKPGRCKKSTAMRMGRELLAKVPGLNFSVDSISRARLIQDLAQSYKDGQSAMTAYCSEFGSFFSTSQMDMVLFLTDIYDSPNDWTHKTLTGGTNKIKQPYFNLVAGTTDTWLAKAMPLDTIGVGLTSRILFVFSDEPRIRPPIPRPSPEQKALAGLLVEDLTTISQLAGEYRLDDEAYKFYNDWYMERPDTRAADPRVSGYFERKPMHVIKLAMVLTAATTDSLVITTSVIEEAIEKLATIDAGLGSVFAHVGRNPYNVDMHQILEAIAISPNGCSKAELLQMFKHNLDDEGFSKTMGTLIAANLVTIQAGGRYVLHPSATA